jgi:hypothetical protein
MNRATNLTEGKGSLAGCGTRDTLARGNPVGVTPAVRNRP